MAATASVSPSVLLHTLFRNDVTKIHVQGSPSTKVPAVVRVSSSDPLKLTMEKLSWRGSPKLTQVQSTSLFVQSATDKTVTWTTASATIPPPYTPNSSSRTSTTQPAATSRPTKETYRVDKLMMLSNPSFSFVMDQIEHQSRLSHGTHTSDTTHSSSKDSKK
ncbi:hypothetical protein BGZ99_006292 [Dissophora globulifera]|uniref:Uncharacterized protein n=1 Tax=Dissophora globulifera TaxID=979702 RepID=A0A9P6RFC5_9FUNG|nr:hypothetical protein BGZ99_006292 [Dissophora globulifera]